MLRKMLTLGALALVAVAFGVGTAAAKGNNSGSGSSKPVYQDGFSDGRLGG